MKYRYIVVEGPIGCGKSTLARLLAEHYRADLLLEDPGANPFLPLFYRDMKRHALSTQMFFLFQRVNQLATVRQPDLFEKKTIADYMLAKDALFAKLYGLDRHDLEVIADTLEIREPSDELGKRASVPPSPSERTKFKTRLESILRPFFKVTGDEPQVELWKPDVAFLQTSAPFSLLLISKRGTAMPAPDGLFRDVLLKLAEDTGSTRIIQQVGGGLLVALLNQYRYWTPSRARLLGAELVREHLDVFDA